MNRIKLFRLILAAAFITCIGCSSNSSSNPTAITENINEAELPEESETEPLEFPYMIGTGIHDITGPPAEVMFAGMADFNQKGEGLYMRLRSRAFIIKGKKKKKSVVLVNTDLGMISQGIQLEVIKKLKNEFDTLYTEKNVVLSATHTHSGPGGYFTCWGLNAAMGMGFCEDNFHTIVNGIVESVKKAHNNLAAGKIYLGSGYSSYKPGERYGWNRSLSAYLLNPKETLENYKTQDGAYDTTNRRMTVLKFVREDGEEVGMYNWAAVHTHVSGQKLKLINGDSKGYAAYLFEKDHGTDYQSDETFVAAFDMNDAGDSSGNLPEDADSYDDADLNENGGYPGDGIHDYERMIKRAKTQHSLARDIYDNANEELTGAVEFRQMYVNFPGFRVNPDFIAFNEVRYHDPEIVDENIANCRLCEPIAGLGMLSGSTEDSVGLIPDEGQAREVTDNRSFMEFIEDPLANGLFDIVFGLLMPGEILQEDRDCHLEKINALPMGRGEYIVPNGKASPEILPIQIIKIGRFAIAALPFEVTTMGGRQLRDDIKNVLDDVTHIEINAVSNGYMGYLTTRDEYAIQHYEGGENWFGPYALNGVRQMFCDLAATLQPDIALPEYALTIDDIENTLDDQKIKVGSVDFDLKPFNKEYGDVIQEPAPSHNKGETVVVKFQGGHPNNNFQIQSTYLKVEKSHGVHWKTIATDGDPATFFRWKPTGLHMSQITIEWVIPDDTEPGTYRISHSGHWKAAITNEISPYTGVSTGFTVQ